MPKEEDSSKSLTQLVRTLFVIYMLVKVLLIKLVLYPQLLSRGFPRLHSAAPQPPACSAPPATAHQLPQRGHHCARREESRWCIISTLCFVVEICTFLEIIYFPSSQLLDISELDMVGAGREAKRRRKTLGKDFPPSVSAPALSRGLENYYV